MEETGLHVLTEGIAEVFERIMPDADGRAEYHYVLIDFLCQRLSGELRAGADAADARWFTPEEIEKLPLALDTAQVIQAALAKTAD